LDEEKRLADWKSTVQQYQTRLQEMVDALQSYSTKIPSSRILQNLRRISMKVEHAGKTFRSEMRSTQPNDPPTRLEVEFSEEARRLARE
jgi:hypothetical protein